jgi:endogenous inhibitor of DNA gyrase (YacG/DUF329 family)
VATSLEVRVRQLEGGTGGECPECGFDGDWSKVKHEVVWGQGGPERNIYCGTCGRPTHLVVHLGRRGMTSALEKRLKNLEGASSGSGGCERCRGTLVIVEDAVSGTLERARWNGEEITGEELREHQTERECPRCGRKIEYSEGFEIRVGGKRHTLR